MLKLVIPVPDVMEPLLRYETHLDRMFSRALMQLEQAQALRREQETIVISKTEKLTIETRGCRHGAGLSAPVGRD